MELSLPFTFFDSAWLEFPPTQSLFFYKLTESSSDFFHSIILPKIKHSLSQTLLYFLPLAGQVIWPPESPRPIIHYSPNDAISLTVAECNAEIDYHINTEILEAIESLSYVSKLSMSETMASTMALQITLFPNKGFSIGITTHHAVFDGKSAFMFLKAFSYICKQEVENESKPFSLLPELTPSFDRTTIKDPAELESFYLNHWMAVARQLDSKSNSKSLEVLPFLLGVPFNDWVQSSFQLSRENIVKIKQSVLLYQQQYQPDLKHVRLSTFVITCAYVLVCLVKAKVRGGVNAKMVDFPFAVDCRSLLDLDLPIPQNYFGNAVFLHDIVIEMEFFMKENGVAIIAEKLCDYINGLEKGVLKGAKERLKRLSDVRPEVLKLGISGSNRLAFYTVDFGWGRPEKVEILSLNANSILLMESRDGNGGVQVGFVLPRHEMEAFKSLFVQGLNAL